MTRAEQTAKIMTSLPEAQQEQILRMAMAHAGIDIDDSVTVEAACSSDQLERSRAALAAAKEGQVSPLADFDAELQAQLKTYTQ